MLVKIDPGKRDIEFFGYICEDMGYLNNANLEAMKYNWCKKHKPASGVQRIKVD